MSTEDLNSVNRSLSRGREPVVSVSSLHHISRYTSPLRPCCGVGGDHCGVDESIAYGIVLIASFFHCSSFCSSAGEGPVICVHHPPLVVRRTATATRARARNEDGALTGFSPVTELMLFLKTPSREQPFSHPNLPYGVADNFAQLGCALSTCQTFDGKGWIRQHYGPWIP